MYRACAREVEVGIPDAAARDQRWPWRSGGVDAIGFSGGVGENREDVRRAILESVRFLGEPEVEVVPACDDLVIARAVRQLLSVP